MNKKIITVVIVLVLLGITFYGGTIYGKGKSGISQTGMRLANGQMGVRGANGAGFNADGGIANGEILSKDATSITIKLRDGGSQIILLSPTTPVMKTVAGSLTDLVIGQNVTVTGKINTDKSITANSIQIRPATTTRQ